jgi:hypothetical protein
MRTSGRPRPSGVVTLPERVAAAGSGCADAGSAEAVVRSTARKARLETMGGFLAEGLGRALT